MATCFVLALPSYAEVRPLFDGVSLEGWETNEPHMWRVEDGAIVCGNARDKIPRNTFLYSKDSFRNFEFRADFKLEGDPKTGMINSGIQFRSLRLPNGTPQGYQADMGDPKWWGGIYDEHRRNRLLIEANMEKLNPVLRRGDWNTYVIRCEGPRSRLWINDVLTADYVEKEPNIPLEGKFALQLHSGGAAKVSFRSITIRVLDMPESPLSPEQQHQTFSLPEGFRMELVASEETGVPKPITVTFDSAGRMWTITALEYPLDANESPAEAAALWNKGGRDKVLIIDEPHLPGPHTPRVFADGLAMPMGVLPYRDGAIIGQGPNVLLMRDTTGDGKADQQEVLLSGFGVQDSHLMPHQFTHLPGGWVLLAQGAFNRSRVVAGDRPPVTFNFCKLGRFRLDRPHFEIAGTGLNNIWGFILDRNGNMLLQEANDMGFSCAPFQVGMNYPGIGSDRSKPYAPFEPAPAAFRMGGTGLSGLALSENRSGGFPAPWADVVFMANPITRTINAVRVKVNAAGRSEIHKADDFLTSTDEWFRPIALTFGPDGCLYIVDWYNKIISHNEVPRRHPDRDKSRGRIWRVRHESQAPLTPPNLARLATNELPAHLNSHSDWAQKAAWQELVQRGDTSIAPEITRMVADTTLPTDARIHALWVLDSLSSVSTEITTALVSSPDRNLRREAAALRSVFVDHSFVDDPDPTVRAQAIRTLSRHSTPTDNILRELIRYGHPEAPTAQNSEAPRVEITPHERAFERYLARAALEQYPQALTAWIDSPASATLPIDNLLFALQALPEEEAATRLAALLPRIQRPLNDSEISTLLLGMRNPDARSMVTTYAGNPASAPLFLDAALRSRERFSGIDMTSPIMAAIAAVGSDSAHRERVVEACLAFTPKGAEGTLWRILRDPSTPVTLAQKALEVLGRLEQAMELLQFARASTTPDELRAPALMSAALSANTPEQRASLFDATLDLEAGKLDDLLKHWASSRNGALAIVEGIARQRIPADRLPVASMLRMNELLPDHPGMKELMLAIRKNMTMGLYLTGKPGDFAQTNLTLSPSFTVEVWLRLDKGISNADGILGRPGGPDFNFHGSTFRVYGGPEAGDLAVASTPMSPDVWTHLAITRDQEKGILRIFMNGEQNGISTPSQATTVRDVAFTGLNIGQTTPSNSGTAGALMEFRVWNHARSAAEIQATMHVSYRNVSPLPTGLATYYPEGGVHPQGAASFLPISNPPRLRTESEAQQYASSFDRIRRLARENGDGQKGQVLFTALCLSCHTLDGKGVNTAPPLDGSGHRELDHLITAILDPDAAVEPGYRVFKIATHSGELVEGYLARQDAEGYTLRFMGGAERTYPTASVKSAEYLPRSFMPPGLIEAFPDEHIRDLFTYLQSLRTPNTSP